MNNMESGAPAPESPGWLRIAVIGRNPKRTLMRAVVLAIFCYRFFQILRLQIDRAARPD